MIKELYQVITNETSLNITSGEIDSVRKKSITKSGCRVYDNGFIGVAGTLGEPTDETWKEAEENLKRKIPYNHHPSAAGERSRNKISGLTVAEFISRSEFILKTLHAEFPNFVLSNKINLIERTVTLENDCGTSFSSADCVVAVSIIVREEGSTGIFDTVIFMTVRDYNVDDVLREAREILNAHAKPVDLPSKNIPVVLDIETCIMPFVKTLDGQSLHRNASLFSGKIGEKLFSDKFSVSVYRKEDAPLVSFFDAEGTTLNDDIMDLIHNGTLLRAYTDKKTADEFNVDCTASADGSYDDVPSLSGDCLDIKGNDTLSNIIGDEYAMFVVVASGGDVTPDGNFASPVQTSYLYHKGHLIGKLPEMNISANISDIFGKDYLGCSNDKPMSSSNFVVSKLRISD